VTMDNADEPGKTFVGTISELLETLEKSVKAMTPEEKTKLREEWGKNLPKKQAELRADDKAFLEDCGIKPEKSEKEE
jgi:hypothetical protein